MHLPVSDRAAYRPPSEKKGKVMRMKSLPSSGRGFVAILILAAIVVLLMLRSMGA